MKRRYRFEERSEWKWWVTPRYLREKPIHRWCIFPHSFTSELVHGLIDEWQLTTRHKILDPFCGAGTTLLAAKERNIPACGYDLSPFAVFASNTKVSNYSSKELSLMWDKLRAVINPAKWNGASREYPSLIKKALPGYLLGAFDNISNLISSTVRGKLNRNFFRMALFSTLPEFSRAVATGGWLKWVDQKLTARSLLKRYSDRVESMIDDAAQLSFDENRHSWMAKKSDARSLSVEDLTFSAVITSPPYPNRHDYTRVFGIELMFGFLDWEQTRKLRYQSFESHPESKPIRPDFSDYREPKSLIRTIKKLETSSTDNRMSQMIKGYFVDIYLSLKEIKRVCKKGAKIAFVVGNAQYGGVPIAVDELTAEVGEHLGLRCEKIVATRYRGNSAQQMSEFGRNPSRESVVILQKL